MPEPRKKRRLWEIDPTVFQPGRKAGFFERRLLQPFKFVGKYVLFALALTYPLYLVIVGIAFGGLVFWAFFAGSVAILGVLITRLGYARNFANWDLGFRNFGVLFLAFLVAMGFYMGLIYLRVWFVPIFVTILAFGLVLFLRRSKT